MRSALLSFLLVISINAFSQDSLFLKVHFLYGSKPTNEYLGEERKWFGGLPGGHVGIEGVNGEILNFVTRGKCHVFSDKTDRHSCFKKFTKTEFYSIFGGVPDSMKKAIVYIPITIEQKKKFDSIANAYQEKTPYDYALFGMRCSAAAYDILAQLNIVKAYSHTKTYKKIFYPKLLRKRLLAAANEKGWMVVHENGTKRRIWEKD